MLFDSSTLPTAPAAAGAVADGFEPLEDESAALAVSVPASAPPSTSPATPSAAPAPQRRSPAVFSVRTVEPTGS